MTQRKPGQPSKLWLAFVEDGFEMVISLIFGLFGLFSLVFSDLLTPPSVDNTQPFTLIVIWHLTSALGLAAAVGRVFEWERLELSGLASLAFSCMFYLGVAIFVVGSASFGLGILLVGVTFGCAFRMYVLKKSLKAQDIAHHVVEELKRNGYGDDL
jgi:hypothetical protein